MSDVVLLSKTDTGIEEDIVLVNAFKRLGFSCSICDWKATQKIKQNSRLVVIRSTWDYTSQHKLFTRVLYELGQHIQLVNHYELVDHTICKSYLINIEKIGITTIPSVFIPNPDRSAIRNGMDKLGVNRFILKSAIGAGGRDMLLFDTSSDLDNIDLSKTFENDGGALLQPYREDIITCGEWALVFIGGILALSLLKKAADGEYRVQRTHGGTETELLPPDDIVTLAREALSTLPLMPDYARVDILPSINGPLLVELEVIEPRLYFDTHPHLADHFASFLADKYMA